MLRSLTKLAPSVAHETERSLLYMSALRTSVIGGTNVVSNYLHTTSKLLKLDDRKMMIKSMPKVDEGTAGERIIDVDNLFAQMDIIPDINTPNRLFGGIQFKKLPITHIKVSPNNTIMSMTDYKGVLKIHHTCGREGFKNARKGTNVAAQATALTFSAKALEDGFKMVRVVIRGLGPGRLASIKGLQMGGLEVVSVTDATRVTWFPLRPRKARRV